MKNSLVKHRSVQINEHRTSISLEDAFWCGLDAIAAARKQTLSATIAAIDKARKHNNLSSALRLAVLDYYQFIATVQPPSPRSPE